MIFCETDQLCATFQEIVNKGNKIESQAKRNPPTVTAPPTYKLVTAKDIQTAVDGGRGPIMLAAGGIVTPLAKDFAKEYDVKIIKGE